MSIVDRQLTRSDPISGLRVTEHLDAALPDSIESLNSLAAIEVDGGFDGMIPDPILEADFVRRLEEQDSHGS